MLRLRLASDNNQDFDSIIPFCDSHQFIFYVVGYIALSAATEAKWALGQRRVQCRWHFHGQIITRARHIY